MISQVKENFKNRGNLSNNNIKIPLKSILEYVRETKQNVFMTSTGTAVSPLPLSKH